MDYCTRRWGDTLDLIHDYRWVFILELASLYEIQAFQRVIMTLVGWALKVMGLQPCRALTATPWASSTPPHFLFVPQLYQEWGWQMSKPISWKLVSSTFCWEDHTHIPSLVRSSLRKKRKNPFLMLIAREGSKVSYIPARKRTKTPHLLKNHLRKIPHLSKPLLKNPSSKFLPRRILQK